MKSGGRHDFFDVPVYRIEEDRYYAEMKAHIDRTMYPPDASWVEDAQELAKREPNVENSFRHRAQRSYGGSWRYNEIIGYIRLHFLGDQIRGEYNGVTRKRIVRTRTKVYEFQTWKLALEMDVPSSSSSEEIFALVKQYVADCQRELKKRYVDTEMFDAVGPYLDWRRLYGDLLQHAHIRGLS
jgi:hypothetical protein